jgi:hypothetical protein
MSDFKLSNNINSRNLIDYTLFTVLDSTIVNTSKPLSELEASPSLINLKIRNLGWTGYRKVVDKQLVIGYANSDSENLNSNGLIESDAYNLWIEEFKDKERKFKNTFILDTLSQSQYDAMLSLYLQTNTFIEVGSDIRKFYLKDYIENREWNYIATAMTLSGTNRLARQADSMILMLGDYGNNKDRSLIKEQGLQVLYKEYSAGLLDTLQSEQAEYVYYAETKRFLPNMLESRKRVLAKQLS